MDMRNFLESLNESSIQRLTEASGAMVGKSAADLYALGQWKYWPEKAYADNAVRVVVVEESPDAWKIYSLSQKAAGAAKSGAAARLAARTKGVAEPKSGVEEMKKIYKSCFIE